MTGTVGYISAKLGSRALQELTALLLKSTHILLGLLLCLPVYADSLCTPEEEVVALAHAMYWEDRTTETGMRAVGHVILNRYNDSRWPDDICGVIYQPSNNPLLPKKCAFSFSCDGLDEATLEVDRFEMAERVAKNLLSMYYHLDITLGALYYYHCNLHGRDDWMNSLEFVVQFGRHCYFIDK